MFILLSECFALQNVFEITPNLHYYKKFKNYLFLENL